MEKAKLTVLRFTASDIIATSGDPGIEPDVQGYIWLDAASVAFYNNHVSGDTDLDTTFDDYGGWSYFAYSGKISSRKGTYIVNDGREVPPESAPATSNTVNDDASYWLVRDWLEGKR